MQPTAAPCPPYCPSALAWLVDWLETGPVARDRLRRVLVVGGAGAEEFLAARLPDAQIVVTGRETPTDDNFDLAAVVGTGADVGPELRAAVAATRDDGIVLVLSSGRAGDEAARSFLSAGWDPVGMGLRLVAFDDLTGASDGATGQRSWLRATYRRVRR